MGPVFVSIPLDDVEYEFTPTQKSDVDLLTARSYSVVSSFDPKLADDLAQRLADAKNPALISSGDVERNGAVADLIALAEAAKASVYTAPFAGWSGFPENHPLYQGLIYPGRGLVSQQLKGHDLVIVLGGPAFRYYPYVPGPYLPEGTSLVHLTSDPDEAARAPIGDAWVCDVAAAIRSLRERTKPSDRSAPDARAAASTASADSTPMDPNALWSTVGRVAPSDALFVTEAGSNEVLIASQVRSGAEFGHMSAAGGGLGFGLPAAVGAQLGAPDRPVIALMGDGSMNYAITALWSAVNSKAPVTVVVASNAEYGILKEFAVVESAPGVPGLDLPGLDVVTVAKGYGANAMEATSTDELADMLKAGVADRDRPTLINVRTTPVGEGHGLV
jgi:benzoylformate decarboxylase